MTSTAQRFADVFVELAAARLSPPAGPTGFLDLLAGRCAALLDGCTAATVRVRGGDTSEEAGSDPEAHTLEHDAADWHEGPGHDCERSGAPLGDADFGDAAVRARWPRYADRAESLGHTHAAACPLRAGPRTMGALVLLSRTPLDPATLALAQSLADFTGIGLEHDRRLGESRVRADQLEHALGSRVLIEQAKGVLSARLSIPPDTAFTLLRGYARANGRLLNEVAREVVLGRLTLNALVTRGR